MLHTDNKFLANLPEDTIERLSPAFETCLFTVGDALVREPVDFAYFILSGLISFTITSDDGDGMEIGMTGNEGFVGTSMFLNLKSPALPGIVRSGGEAIRVPAKALMDEFHRGGQFQALVFQYFRVFFMQVARVCMCNARHSLEKRLGRWLLMTHDRLEGPVTITQEGIANALGVRREAITRVAQQLKSRELIDYGTRRIEVVDRNGLKGACCECYQTMKNEHNALMEQPG